MNAIHPEYQEATRSAERRELIRKFRVGIAEKLKEPSYYYMISETNEDGEDVMDPEDDSLALQKLYQFFKLDDDKNVVEHVEKLQLFEPDEFPTPRSPTSEEPTTDEEKVRFPRRVQEWETYRTRVEERKQAIIHRFRQIVKDDEDGLRWAVDFRPLLGGIALELPLNAEIFMVNNCFLLDGALTLKTLEEDAGGVFQSIDDIITEAETDQAWINNNLAAAIPHLLGINVAYFEVWSNRVVISILNTCPFDAHFILMNNCGSARNPDSSNHYETMGLLVESVDEDGTPANYVQTIFRFDNGTEDPFILKVREEMMKQRSPPKQVKPVSPALPSSPVKPKSPTSPVKPKSPTSPVKPKSPTSPARGGAGGSPSSAVKPKSPTSPARGGGGGPSSNEDSPQVIRVRGPRVRPVVAAITEADLDRVRVNSPRVGYAPEAPSAATTYIPADMYRRFYGREPFQIVEHVEPKKAPVGNAEIMRPAKIIWLPDDMVDKPRPRARSPTQRQQSEDAEPSITTKRVTIRPRARIVIRAQPDSPETASPASTDSSGSAIKPRVNVRPFNKP
jgi:hypothetical protein